MKDDVIKIIQKNLKQEHYRVFFFGSRTTGTFDERSDIDIGIEAGGPIPLSTWREIEEELEKLPVLHKIEIVDFARVSDQFKDVALQQIEVIYEQ